MKKAARPAIFKGRQTEPVFILCAVRWYLRYSLSLRDVEELLVERGLFLQQGYPPKEYRLFFRVYPTEADRERYMRQLREQDEEEKRRYPFSVETEAGVIEFRTEADRDYFLEDFPTPEDKAQHVRFLRRMRAG